MCRCDVRIRYRYRDTEKTFDSRSASVVVGRPRHGVGVDIDLTPDLRVSRPHAEISIIEGHYWIEDVGSANGTEVDGQAIGGKGKIRVEPGQTIRISDTTLEILTPITESEFRTNWSLEERTLVETQDLGVDIGDFIDATAPVFEVGASIDADRA